MYPVHKFKANFNPAETPTDTEPERLNVALHDTDSPVRNLCFVWTDGRRAFFNYAYLISVDLTLSDSLQIMRLSFSGPLVTLKGYRLDVLFDLLLNHTPKTITASPARYALDGQTPDVFIIDIQVKNE